MKPTELPPCPACGGKAKRVYDPDDSRHLFGHVECSKCGLRTRHGTRIGEAVKTWKKRVPAQAVAEAASTLGKALPPKTQGAFPGAPATARALFKMIALARIGIVMVENQLDDAASIATRLLGHKTMSEAMEELKRGFAPAPKAKAPGKAPAKPAKAPAAAPKRDPKRDARKDARKGGRK